MNVDAKVLNKMLGKPVKEHIKKFIHHDHLGFISEMVQYTELINQSKVKNHMTILVGCTKGF